MGNVEACQERERTGLCCCKSRPWLAQIKYKYSFETPSFFVDN